jgi:hypothetical protein
MLAAQLFGTTGVAILLVLSGVSELRGLRDVALVFALLAPVNAIVFVRGANARSFFLAGTVGVLRFPDTHSRLHALTKADNLGLGLVAAGLALQAESAAAAPRSSCGSRAPGERLRIVPDRGLRPPPRGARRRWLMPGWTGCSRSRWSGAWRAVTGGALRLRGPLHRLRAPPRPRLGAAGRPRHRPRGGGDRRGADRSAAAGRAALGRRRAVADADG